PVREGVTFHDVAPANGRAMTAEDVAWSLRRYQAIGQRKADYAAIDLIEATDDKTVTLKLNTQTASVLSNLGDDKLMWVLAKEDASEAEMSNTSPFVGTGPFIWEVYDPDVVIKFRRKPNYWEGEVKPHFDSAEIAI